MEVFGSNLNFLIKVRNSYFAMSLCILEMVLRDKVENRGGNPFIQNKNHSFTSQTLITKRLLAGVCRRLALFWDLLPETIRCLMVLLEYYDTYSDTYESIMLEIIDRLLLRSDEIQKVALEIYGKIQKCYENQKDKVLIICLPVENGVCVKNLPNPLPQTDQREGLGN